jgi:hypothetical protein
VLALLVAACGDPDTGGAVREISADFGLIDSPTYSAYDGEHTYQLLVLAARGVAVTRWEIVDGSGIIQPDAVDFDADSEAQTVTLTTRMPGDFLLLAHSSVWTTCTELHVSAGTPEQQEAGAELYRAPLELTEPMLASGPERPVPASCAACHGQGPEFLGAMHRPLSTAMYSDDQQAALFGLGELPDLRLPATRYQPAGRQSFDGTLPRELPRYFHEYARSRDQRLQRAVGTSSGQTNRMPSA